MCTQRVALRNTGAHSTLFIPMDLEIDWVKRRTTQAVVVGVKMVGECPPLSIVFAKVGVENGSLVAGSPIAMACGIMGNE